MFRNFFKRKNTQGESGQLEANIFEISHSPIYINRVPLETLLPDAYQGLTFLIVDDNEDQLHITAQFLKKHGAITNLAANGSEGLELYLTRPDQYHIILMDIQMPVMNGEEAAREIRTSGTKGSKTIPIVALSGNNSLIQREASDFNSFLNKPFELEQLAYIIEQLCKKPG